MERAKYDKILKKNSVWIFEIIIVVQHSQSTENQENEKIIIFKEKSGKFAFMSGKSGNDLMQLDMKVLAE